MGGNAVIDSQARIGGDTVVLGGNAVYETDDSISGNAYVLGGHLSQDRRPHGHAQIAFSLSPLIFSSVALLAFLLLALLSLRLCAAALLSARPLDPARDRILPGCSSRSSSKKEDAADWPHPLFVFAV